MSVTCSYTVPSAIELLGKREKTYDIYSRLLLDRIVFVSEEVEDAMANAVCAQLLFLEAQDPEKPIKMYINSPGGIVTSGLAIYDTMNYVKCPIATYCLGQAASMGAVLLAAGTKGMRYSLPSSRIMIHQPSGGAYGQASDVEITYREMQDLKDMLNQILAKCTGKKLADIKRATDRDNFMSAEEARKFGIVDKVINAAV